MFSSTSTSSAMGTDTFMVYGKLKKYLQRKRYQRLYPDYGINHNSYDDKDAMLFATRKKKYMKVAKFGSVGTHDGENKTWRIKVSPKLRLKKLLVTPVTKILAGIRDAYVNTMLRLAGNVGSLNGNGKDVFGGKRIPKARQVKEKIKVSSSDKEEFEMKLVYEIYKVLAASRQLHVHGDSGF